MEGHLLFDKAVTKWNTNPHGENIPMGITDSRHVQKGSRTALRPGRRGARGVRATKGFVV